MNTNKASNLFSYLFFLISFLKSALLRPVFYFWHHGMLLALVKVIQVIIYCVHLWYCLFTCDVTIFLCNVCIHAHPFGIFTGSWLVNNINIFTIMYTTVDVNAYRQTVCILHLQCKWYQETAKISFVFRSREVQWCHIARTIYMHTLLPHWVIFIQT